MIIYLTIRYVAAMSALTGMLALIPVLFPDDSLSEAVVQGMFIGGLATPIIIHREFRRRNLWPLYDNLRLSKRTLLGSLTAASLLLSLALKVLL